MSAIKIGIIGGTGLEDPDILQDAKQKIVTTVFGQPSDVLICGNIKGIPCVLLSRHGRKHDQSPSNLPYRANIWALKEEGCTHILVTTACGSLQEQIQPGQIVFLDQFIDRTYKRESTFYDGKLGPPGVCHMGMDKPYCPHTREILISCAEELNIKYHKQGTIVCIEGPRFSTKAESLMFKSWGAHLVGMTAVPEACLAKEAGLFYAAIALPTDYDCWREVEGHAHVSVELVLEAFNKNKQKAIDIILRAVPKIAEKDWSQLIEKNKADVKQAVMLG